MFKLDTRQKLDLAYGYHLGIVLLVGIVSMISAPTKAAAGGGISPATLVLIPSGVVAIHGGYLAATLWKQDLRPMVLTILLSIGLICWVNIQSSFMALLLIGVGLLYSLQAIYFAFRWFAGTRKTFVQE